jgi:hypothetical protein
MGSEQSIIYSREGKLHFFCPLCRYHQSTNTITRVGWKHHAQMTVLTLTTMILGWPLFGLKSASFYLFYWTLFELFYRARKRVALVCESCGFDPFLYKVDVRKARKALKEHWQTKIDKEGLFAGKKLKNYQTKPLQTENKTTSATSEPSVP